MMKTVSVIFDTGATYSRSSYKGGFVYLGWKKFPRKPKSAAKCLEIYGFRIVKYSFRSESGRIIVLQD